MAMQQFVAPVTWRTRFGQRLVREGIAALLIACTCGALAHAQSLQLELETLSGPDWSVRKLQLALQQGGAARLGLQGLVAQGRAWGDLTLECKRFTMDRSALNCADGNLEGKERWPLSFTADLARKTLSLRVAPEAGEEWRLDITGVDWRIALHNASAARLAPLLTGAIKPTAGRVSGNLHLGAGHVDADLRIVDAAFADATGLRAGEKLQGRLTFDATSHPRLGAAAAPADWAWTAALAWDKGAVFWDPLYLAHEGAEAPHRLDARGRVTAGRVVVEQANLEWQTLGRLSGSLDFGRDAFDLGSYTVTGKGLNLFELRALLPQTWLDDKRLGDLDLKGTADLALVGGIRGVEQFALALSGVRLHAAQRHLGIDNLAARFDYRSSGREPFLLSIDALRLQDLRIGPIRAEGELRDGRLYIPNLIAPVLDGILALAEIEVDRESFSLQGALTSVSMEKLAAALGWHPLGGQLSFVLPHVSYARSTMAVDGALLFKLFDGDAQVDAMRLENPFGRTPRLTANLHLKRMNLEAMTSAVKFGTMTGLVDLDVDGLVMENWQPVSMDARVLTSEGAFAKRISQRAVQNISSIGGAGAGAAIQRSFLGFFETFGYDKIGLSCKLRNGICEMGGAEDTASGFMLIKGGGLPSVNVVGYNRFVGWQELLDRIQAVIDGNSRPVFQ